MDENLNHIHDEYGNFVTSELPKIEEEVAYEVAEIVSQHVVRQLQNASNGGLQWRGRMLHRARNPKKISMPDRTRYVIDFSGLPYAGWHEAGEAHWVPLTEENSPIREWAEQNLDADPDVIGALFVQPNPFMKPGVQEARDEIRTFLRGGEIFREGLQRMFD